MARKKAIFRRKPSVDPRPKFFIYAEGRTSEPSYFIQFARQICEDKVRVEAPRDDDSAPITVCNKAINKKEEIDKELKRNKAQSYSEKDQVWAVFDKDSHISFPLAIRKCSDNHVHCAYSIPSFEIWILLHFVYTTRPYASCDEVVADIQNYLKGYSKKDNIVMLEELIDNYARAEENSIRLSEENERTRNAYGNPSTFVHKWTMEMKSAAGIE